MKKVILDLDTGIDDAMALALTLASKELDLIGITGTYGNVLVEDGVQNALDLLALFDRQDIPVYRGRPHALEAEDFQVQEVSAFIHGDNGLGNVTLETSPTGPAEGDAVDFMIQAAREHQDKLSIIATGPMTNLAAAIQKDPDTMEEVGHIYIMGGALTFPGNTSPYAEANISQDPEAADLLFRSGLPVTMVGLDVTTRTLLTYEDTERWRQLGTTSAQTFADIVDYYIKAYETTSPHLKGCALHDPLAVAVAVDSDLVESLPIPLKVETEGPSRGRTIGDPARINEAHPSVQVALSVKVPDFLEEFNLRLLDHFSNY